MVKFNERMSRMPRGTGEENMVKGRKPIPTAIKDANGSHAHNPQRRNNEEPVAKRGWPEKPDDVSSNELASVYWDDYCQQLDELNVLTTSDKGVLTRLAKDSAMLYQLESDIETEGTVLENAKGSMYPNPKFVQADKLANRVIKILTEVGLTPSARSRLKVVGSKEESPFDTWMNSDS